MTGVRVTAAGMADDAVVAELHRRQLRLAQAEESAAATTGMLCWQLGDAVFASALDMVGHVAAGGRTTPLPGAGAGVIGLFARQGIIHTLFDPAALLGVERDAAAGTILLLRQARPAVAIRVDAVAGVIRLPTAALDAIADGTAPTPLVMRPDAPPVRVVDMAALVGHLTGRTPPAILQEG